MSKRWDTERHEIALERQVEEAKERVRVQQEIIRAVLDDEGPSATAKRLGLSRTTVTKWRIILGFVSGRAWRSTGKRTGRLLSKASLMEARP